MFHVRGVLELPEASARVPHAHFATRPLRDQRVDRARCLRRAREDATAQRAELEQERGIGIGGPTGPRVVPEAFHRDSRAARARRGVRRRLAESHVVSNYLLRDPAAYRRLLNTYRRVRARLLRFLLHLLLAVLASDRRRGRRRLGRERLSGGAAAAATAGVGEGAAPAPKPAAAAAAPPSTAAAAESARQAAAAAEPPRSTATRAEPPR